jgi:hypothetical protein
MTIEATHNLYPAYEVNVQKANGIFKEVYRVKPSASTLPGPSSLNTETTGTGGPYDIE